MNLKTTAAGLLLALCLLGSTAWADVPVRVATFNIENFDPTNPTQFNAAVAILQRIGADVICLQEIASSTDLNTLAAAAGYPYRLTASGSNALDYTLHVGILSRYPFSSTATETSITLSGDPNAKDLSRNFAVAHVVIPGAAEDLVMITNHWKSGEEDSDEFRRSVEATRTMQVTSDYDSGVVPYFVVGDMNDDLLDSPDSPSQFTALPSGLPGTFSLGTDLTFPILNGVFKPLLAGAGAQDLTVVNARQKDNSDATRRASGRRIDYLWHSTAVTIVASEVYDSEDEGLPGGLTKYGSPLVSGTSDAASDHMPVFADIEIPDNASGACCTACGCNDTVNEAGCLALGGEFRGAGVACGTEDPPCAALPNDVRINEVLVAPNGTQNTEFLELIGQPHELLCGLTVLVIEGETLSKGHVDRLISLDNCGGSPCALNANGFFVIGGTTVSPAPGIVISGTDIFEDGTETFLLVRDCTIAVNGDVDTNNDGVADVTVGTIIDAIGIVDGAYPVSDAVYFSAPAFGPDGAAVPAGMARCPNGADTDTLADWVRLSRARDGSDGCIPITPDALNPAACGGDYNANGTRDLEDFAAFQQCFGQATLECSAFEMAGSCGIGLDDFAVLVSRLTGP
jgi:exonuclease III